MERPKRILEEPTWVKPSLPSPTTQRLLLHTHNFSLLFICCFKHSKQKLTLAACPELWSVWADKIQITHQKNLSWVPVLLAGGHRGQPCTEVSLPCRRTFLSHLLSKLGQIFLLYLIFKNWDRCFSWKILHGSADVSAESYLFLSRAGEMQCVNLLLPPQMQGQFLKQFYWAPQTQQKGVDLSSSSIMGNK